MKTKAEITEYVFRGTTKDFPGGTSSQKLPYTCTTKSPIIAALFALVCSKMYAENAVVYIAKKKNLNHLKPMSNVLKKYEDELAWPIRPIDFILLTEGYIPVKDLIKILAGKGIKIDTTVTLDSLTKACKASPKISKSDIEQLVKEIGF